MIDARVRCAQCSREFTTHHGLMVHLVRAHDPNSRYEKKKTPGEVANGPVAAPAPRPAVQKPKSREGLLKNQCGVCFKVYAHAWYRRAHERQVHGINSDLKSSEKKVAPGPAYQVKNVQELISASAPVVGEWSEPFTSETKMNNILVSHGRAYCLLAYMKTYQSTNFNNCNKRSCNKIHRVYYWHKMSG
jgi:hypothetical protein